MDLKKVTSSMHLQMEPVTDAVWLEIPPNLGLYVAVSLSMSQAVCSKQSWIAEMSPSDQVLTYFKTGHISGVVCLAGISITEMQSE